MVLPEGYKLQSLESFLNEPTYFRGKYSTTVLGEFISYINKHGDINTGVFIDQEKMNAQAIIDMGNQSGPLWGKHRAEISLLKTPAYSALLESANNALLQQDFIDFAEDWQSNIRFYFDDLATKEGCEFPQIIKTLRRLKVNAQATSEQTVGNTANSRSALESIEIKAGQDELPAGFTFEVVPYEGFEPVKFNCQLRAFNDDKNVKLKYRIGQQELINEDIASEFRHKLINGVKPELNAAIFLGKMAYQV